MSLVYFNTPFNLGDWNDSSWPFGAAVTAGGQPSQITRGKQRIYDSSVVEPKMDWIEQDNKCIVLIEFPSLRKRDIDISLNNGVLTVTGVARPGFEIQRDHVHLMSERHFGAFSRSFIVSSALREEEVKATMECGLLHLEFPKHPKEVETKKIAIEGDE